jgi:hypothetical protein
MPASAAMPAKVEVSIPIASANGTPKRNSRLMPIADGPKGTSITPKCRRSRIVRT